MNGSYLKTTPVLNGQNGESKIISSNDFKNINQIKILFSDAETLELFEYECNCQLVKKSKWKEQIIKYFPDIFFISSFSVFYKPNDTVELKECIEFCKFFGVKVVFWDNYGGICEDFADLAKSVDCIFAISLEKLLFYKTEYGLSEVYFLPYGVRREQISFDACGVREKRLCFVSEINDNSAEYVKQTGMAVNQNSSEKVDLSLTSYVPLKYKMALGRYESKEASIDSSKYGGFFDFYNNGLYVPEEVFKIIASGALVVGNNSVGTRYFFGDSVITQKDKNDVDYLGKLYDDKCVNEKKAVSAYRKVLSEHLYKDRLMYVCNKVYGTDLKAQMPGVEVFCFVDSLQQVDGILQAFSRQNWENKHLTLILDNRAEGSNIKGVGFLSREETETHTLGETTNMDCFTVFSVNDYYGENYLTDLMLPFRCGEPDAVVKTTYFCCDGEKIIEKTSDDRCEIDRMVVNAKSFTDYTVENLKKINISGKVAFSNKFGYCKGFSVKSCSAADDVELVCKGNELNNICNKLDRIKAYNGMFYTVDLYDFYSSLGIIKGLTCCKYLNDCIVLKSNIKKPKTEVTSTKKLSVDTCSCDGYLRINILGYGNGCSVKCNIYDKNENLITYKTANINSPIIIKLPELAEYVSISLVLTYAGNCVIRKIAVGDEWGFSAALKQGEELLKLKETSETEEQNNGILIPKVYKADPFIRLNKRLKLNGTENSVNDIRFACVMLEERYTAYYSDFNSVLLTDNGWKDELEDVSLLIVECCDDNFEKKYLFVKEIAEYCNLNNIAIAVICGNISELSWKFLQIGNMADCVFTVDIDSISRYKQIFNNDKVYLQIPFINCKSLNYFKQRKSAPLSPTFFDENDLIHLALGDGKVEYSRALRNYFGDLVFNEGDKNFNQKKQLALLRKISEEFSAESRLAYIFSKVLGLNFEKQQRSAECEAEELLFKGKSCEEVQQIAEKLPVYTTELSEISSVDFYDGIIENKNIKAEKNEQAQLCIENIDVQRQFLYCGKKLMISECPVTENKFKFRFNGMGDSARGYVTLYNDNNRKLKIVSAPFNVFEEVEITKECSYIKLSVRIEGSESCTLVSVSLMGAELPNEVFIPKNETIVLSNQYPSKTNIYINMFVHQRMIKYKERGFNFDIVCASPSLKSNYRMYDGIDVTDGGYQRLDDILNCGGIKNVYVHFINEKMWQVLKKHKSRLNQLIWCHGYDIQPWWRRAFAYEGEELERQKLASERRMVMWNEIFDCLNSDNIKLVIVSESLRDDIFEDYKIQIPQDKYEIIHNCIDTDVFNYVPKDISQRAKIMSVKSYSTAVYANDITANAILELSKTEIFDKLEFDLYGNGPLFEKCNEKIMNFENVHFHREFLEHSEIAKLHKAHGIYIGTTRSDTQGISRDEAMSSGLVPIANAVCAIPEFVDSECGILVPAEDYKGVAQGIIDLYNNPDLFLKLSENAAKRVRSQTSPEFTIAKELELIKKQCE